MGDIMALKKQRSSNKGRLTNIINFIKASHDDTPIEEYKHTHIINGFLHAFIEQPAITTANPNNVKQLMDTSDEVIRGLKALGESAEARDHWLIFLLVQKLDDKSKVLWAEYVTDMENPQFSHFLEFLSRRIDALETMNMSLKKSIPQGKVKSHVSTEKVNYDCALCSESNHYLSSCKQFNEMNIASRKDWVISKNRCFNCLSHRHLIKDCSSKGRCQICHKKHHTLLHTQEDPVKDSQQPSVSTELTTSLCSQNSSKCTILPTAMIKIMDCNSRPLFCRALLDSGFQSTFISESCVQRLGLKKTNARLSITGLSSSSVGSTKGKVVIIVRPNSHPEMAMEALILPKITSNLPHQSFKDASIHSWPKVQFADPQFHKSSRIDVLIGADYFFGLLEPEQMKIRDSDMILQKTILGWIVAGSWARKTENMISMFAIQTDVDLDKTLRRFWEIESVPNIAPILSPEETLCESHFTSHAKIDSDGRFTVKLPFIKSVEYLGKSLQNAVQRLRAMERRFARDPEFQEFHRPHGTNSAT